MNLGLDNKNYLIAGSSRGIGVGIAEVLLSEGANVMVTGRQEADVNGTVKKLAANYPGKVFSHTGDLSDDAVLQNLQTNISKVWKELHGVVANAGAVKPVNDWDISNEDWDWYFSAKLVTRLIPSLIVSKGSIVLTGSIAGLEDIGAPLPYSTSKVALTMYSKGLSRKLAPHGIRVNMVAPGNILFEGGNWQKRSNTDPDAINKMLDAKVPLKQFGSPDDIGNMVAFLLSEKAKFITGSCMVVDGGQTAMIS
jgi:3-oxoacyl-[acyl-carrier protein] reductase